MESLAEGGPSDVFEQAAAASSTQLGPVAFIGIALALISAVLLTFGNAWQSRGVAEASADHSGSGSVRLVELLRRPVWLAGGGLLVLSVLVQLGALAFAPLIVVQPIGVTAIVFSSLLTAASTHRWPRRSEVVAIAVCVISIAVFVSVAAKVSTQSAISDRQLVTILVILAVVLIVTVIVLVLRRGVAIPPFIFVLLGGLYSGFVATLGKTAIARIGAMLRGNDSGDSIALTIACVVGIGIAAILTFTFVQIAHSANAPEVVVAGLTVVDPTVAVLLGITVLHEAAGAPAWSIVVFVIAGVAAMGGVIGIARSQRRDEVTT